MVREMADLLRHITPRHLHRDEESWVLEVERYICVMGDIYRPLRQKVHGPRAILAHLEHNPRGQLLSSATRALFETSGDGEEGHFDAVDGQWIPSEARLELDAQAQKSPPTAALAHLELGHRDSARRIAELELRLEKLEARFATMATVAQKALDTSTELSDGIRNGTLGLATAEQLAGMQGAAGAGATEAEAEEPAAQEGGPVPEWEAPVYPSIKVVRDTIEQLVMVSLSTKEVRGREEVEIDPSSFDSHFFCMLIDDDDREVGAMIGDLQATVRLGCELMGIPDGERDTQLKTGRPSEDVIEAMSEIFNTLSGPVNLLPGNMHLRIKALAELDVAEVSWLVDARERVSLDLGEFGKIWLLGW